ncbi:MULTISPECIES: exodeoxyribonuclease III [Candidatus Ichthyocystis]|uniref:Exodeoxyribonuclease III n=1 Tax=Candidatus Ichthyocystis hellenicum TaxID=1561003 RepID=A0A0S4M794_9BURK|nr:MULTISPECIES: exodeoxyribonuclease III [Ichthyocystis]CUT17268.1 Exodeoxyribonuclease III [Candidatus Ichthyocystis hellenicum]
MKVATLNLNGLRSAYRKGLSKFIQCTSPDVFCVQEIRIDPAAMSCDLFFQDQYRSFFCPSSRKGYSGVGIYTRFDPVNVITKFDNGEFDREGRCIGVELEALWVFSVYFPSGSSSSLRQEAKFRFLTAFSRFFENFEDFARKPVLLCGDFNIAHQPIDLKNWRSNQRNPGFLPEERDWLTQFMKQRKMLDVFRFLYPKTVSYTWWSQRGKAREKDVGWRIDYQITSCALADKANSAYVYVESNLSDHAPLVVNYDL